MSHRSKLRTQAAERELMRVGLPDVHADFDESGACYLSGRVDRAEDEARAVQVVQAYGAAVVCDGIEAPAQELPHLHRKQFMPFATPTAEPGLDARARLLSGADLTDRLFDASTRPK